MTKLCELLFRQGSRGEEKSGEINRLLALYLHFLSPDECTGASDDWAYDNGARYSYTIELPPKPKDKNSFMVMPEEIIPIATETFHGIRAMIKTE